MGQLPSSAQCEWIDLHCTMALKHFDNVIMYYLSLIYISFSLFIVFERLISEKYYFCHRSLGFVPMLAACDGRADCRYGEDESNCVSNTNTTSNTTFPGSLHAFTTVCPTPPATPPSQVVHTCPPKSTKANSLNISEV